LDAQDGAEEEDDAIDGNPTMDLGNNDPTANIRANARVQSFSHMVTMTGFNTDDMTLSYMDPNNPGTILTAMYTVDANGYITFNWDNMGANAPVNGVYIFEAFAESPVPLPATVQTGLVLLVLGTAGRWRKRFRISI
jgi:hypothetical protein